MNILSSLRRRLRIGAKADGALREKLPEVNSFVDIAVEPNSRRESIPVDDITATEIVTHCPDGLQVGSSVDFLYVNPIGRFRFGTTCVKVNATDAHFALPASIRTIEAFAHRRMAERVPWVIPAQWRYAPDGTGYGAFLPGSLMDLSRGGASLVVARELKGGSQVEVRFTLKSKNKPFVELCEVMRAAKIEASERIVAGIRFVAIDRHDEQTLIEYLQERQMLRRNRGVV